MRLSTLISPLFILAGVQANLEVTGFTAPSHINNKPLNESVLLLPIDQTRVTLNFPSRKSKGQLDQWYQLQGIHPDSQNLVRLTWSSLVSGSPHRKHIETNKTIGSDRYPRFRRYTPRWIALPTSQDNAIRLFHRSGPHGSSTFS